MTKAQKTFRTVLLALATMVVGATALAGAAYANTVCTNGQCFTCNGPMVCINGVCTCNPAPGDDE